MNDFYTQLTFGKLGESKIANWIKANGMHVLPVYEKQDHDYKGPTLYAAEGDTLILPDLLALEPCGEGRIRLVWCEAKNKSTFTWHRKSGNWQTGIDRHLLDQYLEVQRRTSIPIYLLFLQNGGRDKDTNVSSPQGLYGNRLTYLSANIRHDFRYTDASGRSVWMVYWNISDLRLMASLEEIETAQTRRLPIYHQVQALAVQP